MTKLATTAALCAALVGASTTAFAGGLTSPIVEPQPEPVMMDQGGLDWRHAAIAAGVIGLGLLVLNDDDDDDSSSSSSSSEAGN